MSIVMVRVKIMFKIMFRIKSRIRIRSRNRIRIKIRIWIRIPNRSSIRIRIRLRLRLLTFEVISVSNHTFQGTGTMAGKTTKKVMRMTPMMMLTISSTKVRV